MKERVGEAFAGTEPLTVVGRQLKAGELAPDFHLAYLDLADLVIRTVSLADSVGLVRLLSVVNSLKYPISQHITRQWDVLCMDVPPGVCIYTVSRDSPHMQATFQDTAGVLHQVLSAHQSEQFGQDYGVWLKEWRLFQQAIFVLDRNACIVYVEYVADQLCEPDYLTAMQAVQQADVA